VLGALLLCVALLLALTAVRLVVGTLRPVVQVVDHEPAPVLLEPLEHALRELESAVADGHVDQQRRALELLADELGGGASASLAREARRLAWSAHDPDEAETRALVQAVRDEIRRRTDGE
jgi:hypothetical protein